MKRINIEGHLFSMFMDYDKYPINILAQLSDDGKIEWLERRMNMIFLDPMRKIYNRNSIAHKELHRQKNRNPMNPMLMMFSLLLNGIEALGSFLTPYNGNCKNARRFNTFMNTYMANWTQIIQVHNEGNRRISEFLWEKYRNGLAHSFAILNAGIDDVPGNELTMIQDDILQIDGWKFFNNLLTAINNMFRDIRNNANSKTIFLQRFHSEYL